MRKRSFPLCLLLLVTLRAETQANQVPVQLARVVYPLEAKAEGIEGQVTLKGTIDRTGKLRDLRVIFGRAELRQAAMDAVVQWRYRPYEFNVELVEVPTTVTVNFSLGNKTAKAKAMADAKAELAAHAQSPTLGNTHVDSPQ